MFPRLSLRRLHTRGNKQTRLLYPEGYWRCIFLNPPGEWLSPPFPALFFVDFSLLPDYNAAEHFKVNGPDQPVIAILGEDVVLPCHFFPAISAEHMQVSWLQTSTNFIVHQYKNGMDQNQDQMPKYRDRTEFIKYYISCGSVSLRIRNIGLSDEGQYTCYFQFDTYYDKATVELKVAGLGNVPSISVNDHQDREISVLCESAGWYPEPEVTWRHEDGQSLTPASETETEEHNGLFNIKTSLLRTNQHGRISCHIRNIILNQERESAISISAVFYQRVSRWMASLTLILVSVIIPCGLLVVLAVYHLKKERKEKAKLSADNEKLTADNEKLLDSTAKLTANNAKLTADNGKLSADIEMLTADKNTLSSKNEKLMTDNAKLTTDNGKHSADIEMLTADKKSLRTELEWRRCCSYAVDVTLETAHPILLVSEDRKSVRGGTKQNLPDNPERFDIRHAVLGCQSFTSGRHYWEVQVEDTSFWMLGVCKDSVKRKGGGNAYLGDGYWTVKLCNSEYSTFPSLQILPSLRERPQAVGIFLDYEAGQVSLYNLNDKSLLHTFTSTFTETLRPFFSTDTTPRIRPVASWE
ncbi:butyrophilin subfamily 2 member A2-like [Microcaecilia unicolor]|uniref:Butyrophilin subfamily 2 member A2-like n=1 Tax=Microcaecilia unicolor TaxID=1415580 RepID=A0A6P7XCW5_9AMPH|nr:butyrophilin subfamily 2 member A2-like [Microcaecilia unicolor]